MGMFIDKYTGELLLFCGTLIGAAVGYAICEYINAPAYEMAEAVCDAVDDAHGKDYVVIDKDRLFRTK